MSRRLAAGWARSRFQSVSVVPMIQWLSHGNHEEHALLGAQDQARIAVDPVAGDDEMDALRGAHLDAAAARVVLDRVGPDARRVDDLAAADREARAGLEAARDDARDPRTRDVEALGADARERARAVQARRADEREGVSRVVDLGVPVLDAADHAVAPQRRESARAHRAASDGDGAAARGGRPACRRAARRRRYRRAPRRECVSGNRKGTGRTRCGQSRSSIRVCSCSASRTSPNSSCSR